MDHHMEGKVVFYEGKNRDTQLFRMRHAHDATSVTYANKSEQIMQITKNDAWEPELTVKVVTFFNDMLSKYAKGQLTKFEVGQEKKLFMTQAVMPLRKPTKTTLGKGITSKPAASDTVVSEATKSAASDTVLVEPANKRQKVTASVNVVATPVRTSHSEWPCSATNDSAGASHSEESIVSHHHHTKYECSFLGPDVPRAPPVVFWEIQPELLN